MQLNHNKALFIDRQIPGFIREEYPLFAEFIKQYYSFLDQEAGKVIAVKVLDGGSNYNPITAWAAASTFQKQTRISYDGRVYLVTNTGITGVVAPTHTSGTVSDGSISLTYVGSGSPTTVTVSFRVKDPLINQFVNDPRIGSDAAAGYVIINSGSIDKIIMTNYGSGYTEDDDVQAIVSGGGGSGAIIEAITTNKLGNINSAVTQTLYSRDIDQAIPEFVELLRKELIPALPKKLYREDSNEIDVTKFVKFIRQFYNSKGAEKSIKFLFRVLFNSDVNIYYPKMDMLRVSDGKWTIDKVIRITPSVTNITTNEFRELYLGERIIGETSGVTAIIQDIDSVAIATGGGTVFELKISDINGSFNPSGETIRVFKLDNSIDIEIGTIKQCIQTLEIEDGGIGYQVGDQIIYDNSFLAKVVSVGPLGVISKVLIDNFGFDYSSEPYDTDFITTGGTGAILRGKLGVFLTYPGYYIGTDGQPSSAKRIQDSEYYQDFSYEIISDQSANIFGQLLNRTIHPAGLKLFSKILSIKAESIYNNRLNFNPSYDRYTFIVPNDEFSMTDFDISSLLNNGTQFLSSLSVAEGLILFTRSAGFDYLFEVIQPGVLGNNLPLIQTGNQISGTATLRFIGVAERPLSVFLNGSLKILNVDYILQDANTIRFNYPLIPGSIVRIVVRPDNLFTTDYNEYVKEYTTLRLRKNTTLREPFFMYSWYAGLSTSALEWERLTSYQTGDIIFSLGNYYLVLNDGESGTRAPSFVGGGIYSNGELSLKSYNPHTGYVGDIIYYGNRFYKITGTTNANISGIFGQTAPVHTSGSVVNGSLVLTYHNPGFRFWESGLSVSIGDILYYDNMFYHVIGSGVLGSTPPTETSGSFYNGTALLQIDNISYDSTTKILYVSQLDPGKSMLGPTVNDIERNAYIESPQFFQDIPGTQTVVAGSTMSVLDLGEAGLSREDDEYIEYSIIITFANGTSAGNRVIRVVTGYDGFTKTVTFNSTITIPNDCTSVQYRLLQNYLIGSYDSINNKLGLSPYDKAYNLNALIKTQYSFNANDDVVVLFDSFYINNHNLYDRQRLTYYANGGTPVGGLTDGTTYYVKVLDVDNIRLCLNDFDIDDYGYQYIDITSLGSGTQFLYLQNELYQNYNLIVTSGGGFNSVLNIIEYNEIDNTITFENTPTGTIVPGESTYYIYPDLYNGRVDGSGANENYHASSIVSLVISSGGKNYTISDTITFVGGYGSSASASISSVDGSGRITGIDLTSTGFGYIYSPRIVVNSSNGTGASIYPILSYNASIGMGSYYKYSLYGHYRFQLTPSYYPASRFECGETVTQGLNKARVIKYDGFNKILYLETDEESDEFLYNSNLIRVKDNSTITIQSGEAFHSGWKSTNIPVGSIIKTYKSVSNPSVLGSGSFINEFGELTYMTTYLNLTTSNTIVDINSATTYRTVKYLIQASYSGFYQFSEIILIHNGTIVDIVEHSVTHTSAAPLVTFSAQLSVNEIRLIAAAAAGSTTNLVIYKCPIVI
jgi:hypothetical protein